MRIHLAAFAAMSLLAGACGDKQAPVALPSTLQMVTTPTLPQFSVTGSAKLEVIPDCADITLTIAGESARTAQATADSKARQEQLMTALGALAIPGNDIKLSGVQLSPLVEYDRAGKVLARRFRAETRVVVTTRDFTKISDIMDAAATAGINQMSSEFRREDIDGLKQKVRDMALDAAVAKAKQMTTKLGVRLGAVVGIAENTGGHMWNNAYFQNVAAAEDGVGMAMGVQSQALTLDVTVTYQLPPS